MHISGREFVLVLLPTLLQCAIVAVIFRRNLYTLFPAFTTYTICQIISTAVLTVVLVLQVSSLHYAYTFYPIEVCGIGLAVWVIYEIFQIVFEPYEALRRSWRFVFMITVVALVAISIFWLMYAPGTLSNRLTHSMILLIRSLRFVQVGLLIVLFALSRFMGLSWRSYCFGVALGYGAYAAFELLEMAMRAEYGDEVWELLNKLRSLSYAVTILIWGSYFLQPTEVAESTWVVPHNDIEKWNHALEGILARRSD
jgi:hypothetical protein